MEQRTATGDRLWSAIELALVAGSIVAVSLFEIMLPALVPLVALSSISLWARGKSWMALGLSWREGSLAGVAGGMVVGAIAQLVLWWSAPDVMDFNVLPQVRGNFEVLATALILVWVGGALAGEMVYRGYLFELFDRLVPARGQQWTTLVLAAAVYGAATGNGVIIASIGNAAAGLGYGLLYRASRRNLALPIAVHGAFESTNLILVYASLT
jgi:membrane protease YdiL (CAAX protease family)